MTVGGGTFDNNYAGLYSQDTGTAYTVTGGTFDGNGYSGLLALTASGATISGGTFSGNKNSGVYAGSERASLWTTAYSPATLSPA